MDTLPPLPVGLRAALAMFVMEEQRKALETGRVNSCSNSLRCKDLRRSIRAYAQAAMLAERAACIKIAEEHAADTKPSFKPFEDTYLDGWLDASNEIGWAIRARG